MIGFTQIHVLYMSAFKYWIPGSKIFTYPHINSDGVPKLSSHCRLKSIVQVGSTVTDRPKIAWQPHEDSGYALKEAIQQTSTLKYKQ